MTASILLLGGSGYVGQAFAREIQRRGWQSRSVRRAEVDYARFGPLSDLLRDAKPDFVVNCAGFTGKPNVDACESQQSETLLGNVALPVTIAHACESAGIPWGHVSSGCIYAGARLRHPDGSITIERDLTQPNLRRILDQEPERILGFTESCPPNFSFRSPPCSFYSGSKALGEEALVGAPATYLWRLRIPFDERDGPRNYLSKVQRYSKVYDNANSISHLTDFARCCLELWDRRAPFGTYNVTNPGFTTTKRVVELVVKHLRPNRPFEFWASDEEFYRVAAKTPRSNCVMDTAKLLATGIRIQPVESALEDALTRWVPER
ncbi:MAG: sugar nucleotide-binding protein [Limisphaerales bacterium]